MRDRDRDRARAEQGIMERNWGGEKALSDYTNVLSGTLSRSGVSQVEPGLHLLGLPTSSSLYG